MSSSYHEFSENAADDVRWERVEHSKLKLTSGAYSVAAEEVAAKLIEYMLDLGRANYRRKTRRPGKKTRMQSTDVASSRSSQTATTLVD